jgi:hypothetical protein
MRATCSSFNNDYLNPSGRLKADDRVENNLTQPVSLESMKGTAEFSTFNSEDIDAKIAVYPNPVSANTFTVESLNGSVSTVEVFSVLGVQVPCSQLMSDTDKSVNVSVDEQISGTYLLKIVANGKLRLRKVVFK